MGATDLLAAEDWLDPLEQHVLGGVRQILQELIEQDVTGALGRLGHGRTDGAKGYRHRQRPRTVMGTFGRTELTAPRARVRDEDGRGSRQLIPSRHYRPGTSTTSCALPAAPPATRRSRLHHWRSWRHCRHHDPTRLKHPISYAITPLTARAWIPGGYVPSIQRRVCSAQGARAVQPPLSQPPLPQDGLADHAHKQ
jgi:hypothetical protein